MNTRLTARDGTYRRAAPGAAKNKGKGEGPVKAAGAAKDVQHGAAPAVEYA